MGTVMLTGIQKAAILLVALGAEAAGKVLKSMHYDEVERISIEMAKLRNVSSGMVESVLLEFRHTGIARDYVASGGVGFAREVLEGALGPRHSEELMKKVEAAMEMSGFNLIQTVETGQLINFLQNEHPQTVALILANLNPRKAADIVSGLSLELRNSIMHRLATMGKTSPELLRDIEEVVRLQIGLLFGTNLSASGGIRSVAEILNNTSRRAEHSILEFINNENSELAVSIKSLMFVFDDLMRVSDQDLQRILKEVEQKDLVLALKASSEDLKQKFFRNVSERAAQMLQEEMELMGPARVSDVDEAQRRIVEAAHQLEQQEEIVLSRSGDHDLVL